MNKILLTGRLVRDAEVKYTQSGTTVAQFTMAVDRPVAKGEQKEADFISCVAFGKLAETIGNYTQKGSKIMVEGRLQVRNYENKEGKKVYVSEVIVNGMEFLESKNKTDQADFGSMGSVDTSDIPF